MSIPRKVWRDGTSYSQGTPRDQRVPRIWNYDVPHLTITVHRYRGCDNWFLSTAPGLFDLRTLEAADVDDAKQEALHKVRARVAEIAAGLAESSQGGQDSD